MQVLANRSRLGGLSVRHVSNASPKPAAAKGSLAPNSPDLETELLEAIMGALDAHTAMSTQALNSPTVQRGIKDVLLNNARLYESLRDAGGRS